jgi:hypothetical protein
MPLPTDAILSASISSEPMATIHAPEMQPGDIMLVCQHRQLWWRRILQNETNIPPPSLSRIGWTFLAEDPHTPDAAWILRGVESIEHDPGSFADPVRSNEFWIEPPEVGTTIGRWPDAATHAPDILDRIDDTLTIYDQPAQPEDRPWPYRSF